MCRLEARTTIFRFDLIVAIRRRRAMPAEAGIPRLPSPVELLFQEIHSTA